jgi:spermidine synthase
MPLLSIAERNLSTTAFDPSPVYRAAAPGVAAALVALFAASGCAALVYQVVWFERLSLAIGSSALSLGVLLATFLGGMGLGSWLAPRVLAGHAPLHRLALVELVTGVLGLATLVAIPLLASLYTAWAGSFGLAVRLVVAAVALLPAAVLMGTTLPIVAAWAPRAAAIGACYAANAAGGAAGSVLAAFYLLRVHDVVVATAVAAALNVLAAAGALLLARSATAAPQRLQRGPGDSAPVAGGDTAPIYAVTAFSGFTALAAEVLWTRQLALLLGGTVYTFALVLAVFLLGLALGSAAAAALGTRDRARTALALCQWLLCLALASGAYAVARSLPYWPLDVTLPTAGEAALELDLLRAAWVALPAALLWGASFPFAVTAALTPGVPRDRVVGRLYAANTLGAIAGALLTTFVLVATIGSARAQQLLIVVSAAAGWWLLAAARRAHAAGLRRFAAASAAAAALAGLALTVPALPPELIAYGRFLPTRGADANVVYVGEGLTSSIAVAAEPSGILTYHNAGKTQASTYPQDLRVQRMLGHLGTLLAERPAAALVIGLGAGITAGAVAIDPAVERVVVAEIEPLVPEAAAEFFGAHNFGVVTSPKVEIEVDDGRHVLATTTQRFDVITSDPLDPWVKGAAALYTREFWQLCRARLNEGGVVTVFVQLYESNEDAVRSELATFFGVFPDGLVFANTVDGLGYDLVLVGRLSAATIDVTRLRAKLARPDYAPVASSLRAVGFASALDLASTYTARGADLAPWLAGASINTDRNLRLQYLAGSGVNVFAASAIFASLVGDGPRFPAGLFVGAAADVELLEQRVAARRGAY